MVVAATWKQYNKVFLYTTLVVLLIIVNTDNADDTGEDDFIAFVTSTEKVRWLLRITHKGAKERMQDSEPDINL